jgi:DNA adenine methylase
MRAPFPWFGGKRLVAAEVWRAFGSVGNYVEPFAVSLAVLLGAPEPAPVETVNDADGLLANFWRALQQDPDVVAYYADWPANEADLHARHLWLNAHRPRITEHLMGDPAWCDPKAAGWWAWGIGLWIGGGWCAGKGPWHSADGALVKGDSGRGVHRKSLSLGNSGRGVHRKSLSLGNSGMGGALVEELRGLAARLRRVRVNCGDWTRVLGPSVLQSSGRGARYAVFLDPPYAEPHAVEYAAGGGDVAGAVREWAIAHGEDAQARIALCTYSEEPMPEGWRAHRWKAAGGYGSQGSGRGRANARREVVWFSPGCLGPSKPALKPS